MKIAIFHDLGPGGAKRQLFEQVKRLSARGHSLDLFVTEATAADDATFLPLAPYFQSVKTYGDGACVSRGGNSSPSPRGRLRTLVESLPAGKAAAEWLWVRRMNERLNKFSFAQADMAADIDEGRYDLAYICQSRLTLAPDLLIYLETTPKVFCCNDTLRAAYEWAVQTAPGYDEQPPSFLRRKSRGRWFSPASLAFDAQEERNFVWRTREANCVLANSWYTRERLLCTTGVEAQVCYPCVDSEFYCPDSAIERDRRLVVSVGALLPTKRHALIIDAVATLPVEIRPRIEIIGYESQIGSAGMGPEGQRLCTLAGDRDVELTIRREVTDEVVRDAYRRAGAVVFAPYLEPLGLVALEAMACGAPVVGIAEAGVRETVRDGETGLLTGGNPAELGAAIGRVLTDPVLAERLGTVGRVTVENEWDWERSVDRLETIFQRVAASSRAGERV